MGRKNMLEKSNDGQTELSLSNRCSNKSKAVPLDVMSQIVLLSPYGCVITDYNEDEKIIVYGNRSFEEITGYQAKEVIGHSCRSLFGLDKEEESLSKFDDAIERGLTHTEVVRSSRKNGSPYYNEITVIPIMDSSGETSYLAWIQRDVTSTIKTEEETAEIIAEKDARFLSYMENSNEALYRVDFDPPISLDDSESEQVRAFFDRGKYSEANDVLARIYGQQKGSDVRGKPLNKYMRESEPENITWATNLVRSKFKLEDMLSREKGADGREIIGLNNVTPAVSNGKVEHLWGAGLDITDLIEAQEKLRQSTHELAKKTKALEEKNIALKELVTHIELQKKEFTDRVMTNISEIALPSLERIKINKGDDVYIEQHRLDLENLVSSFGLKVTEIRIKLTPREMEVCNLVRNGLVNKEIAQILKIALHTVEKHRRTIRKKLGLTKSKVNLHSYLNSL